MRGRRGGACPDGTTRSVIATKIAGQPVDKRITPRSASPLPVGSISNAEHYWVFPAGESNRTGDTPMVPIGRVPFRNRFRIALTSLFRPSRSNIRARWMSSTVCRLPSMARSAPAKSPRLSSTSDGWGRNARHRVFVGKGEVVVPFESGKIRRCSPCGFFTAETRRSRRNAEGGVDRFFE